MNNHLLKQWKNEYLEHDGTYSNHVTKFVDYMVKIGKANQPIMITKEDLDDSIGYYNSLGKINTIKTMESHIEAVKAFYRYLVGQGYAEDILNNMASFQEFKARIATKYKLLSSKEKSYWDLDFVIEIIEILDDFFERNEFYTLKPREQKRFIKFLVLRIFIKLTLIAPAKKSAIGALKNSDFSEGFRNVIINSVRVKVPNGLRRDIKFSIQFIEQVRSVYFSNDDLLLAFLHESKFRVENLNEIFCTFLKTYKLIDIDSYSDTYPVEPIMEAVLYAMVRNGVNPALIAKINGTTLSNIDKKFYSSEIPIDNADSQVNNEIGKLEYYNYI